MLYPFTLEKHILGVKPGDHNMHRFAPVYTRMRTAPRVIARRTYARETNKNVRVHEHAYTYRQLHKQPTEALYRCIVVPCSSAYYGRSEEIRQCYSYRTI